MENKQILIAGAGSIGTVLGLYLQRQGHYVKLLRRRGSSGRNTIKLVGVDEFSEDMHVISKNAYNQNFKPDLIILASQRQQLSTLLEDVLDILKLNPKSILVSTQNGLQVPQTIDKFLEKHNFSDIKIIQAIIWWSATLVDDTQVLYHNKADTIIGIPNALHRGDKNTLDLVFDLLHDNFTVEKTENIESTSQYKLILNIVSPILALLKQPYPTALNDLITRKIVHSAFDDVVTIAQKAGWFEWDDRLRNFHTILTTNKLLDHYSLSGKYPIHKVSTQISAEKYGGKNSNAYELLYYFIERQSQIAKILLDLVEQLEPNYTAMTSSELYNLLEKHITNTCNLVIE